MNYIKQVDSFLDWIETNHISGLASLLWLDLMSYWYISGKCEWTLANERKLMQRLEIDNQAKFRKVLSELESEGLVEYEKIGRDYSRYHISEIQLK